MVPGPVQAAAIAAWSDDQHVQDQRRRYSARLEAMRSALASIGVQAPMPAGAFYLWAPAPGGDAWALARRLAEQGGALVSPGEFYGPDAVDHVRIAVVQPDDRIEVVAQRLAAAGGASG
jgi:aspartate/methionine/tyrosine aminotransferase